MRQVRGEILRPAFLSFNVFPGFLSGNCPAWLIFRRIF